MNIFEYLYLSDFAKPKNIEDVRFGSVAWLINKRIGTNPELIQKLIQNILPSTVMYNIHPCQLEKLFEKTRHSNKTKVFIQEQLNSSNMPYPFSQYTQMQHHFTDYLDTIPEPSKITKREKELCFLLQVLRCLESILIDKKDENYLNDYIKERRKLESLEKQYKKQMKVDE